jgi:hypothetical protein
LASFGLAEDLGKIEVFWCDFPEMKKRAVGDLYQISKVLNILYD